MGWEHPVKSLVKILRFWFVLGKKIRSSTLHKNISIRLFGRSEIASTPTSSIGVKVSWPSDHAASTPLSRSEASEVTVKQRADSYYCFHMNIASLHHVRVFHIGLRLSKWRCTRRVQKYADWFVRRWHCAKPYVPLVGQLDVSVLQCITVGRASLSRQRLSRDRSRQSQTLSSPAAFVPVASRFPVSLKIAVVLPVHHC